jgi:hypothetical protein
VRHHCPQGEPTLALNVVVELDRDLHSLCGRSPRCPAPAVVSVRERQHTRTTHTTMAHGGGGGGTGGRGRRPRAAARRDAARRVWGPRRAGARQSGASTTCAGGRACAASTPSHPRAPADTSPSALTHARVRTSPHCMRAWRACVEVGGGSTQRRLSDERACQERHTRLAVHRLLTSLRAWRWRWGGVPRGGCQRRGRARSGTRGLPCRGSSGRAVSTRPPAAAKPPPVTLRPLALSGPESCTGVPPRATAARRPPSSSS